MERILFWSWKDRISFPKSTFNSCLLQNISISLFWVAWVNPWRRKYSEIRAELSFSLCMCIACEVFYSQCQAIYLASVQRKLQFSEWTANAWYQMSQNDEQCLNKLKEHPLYRTTIKPQLKNHNFIPKFWNFDFRHKHCIHGIHPALSLTSTISTKIWLLWKSVAVIVA